MSPRNGAHRALLALLTLSLAACQCDGPPNTELIQDAGEENLARADAGEPDAGDLDAGELDAGELDAGEVDAGEVDAGEVDAGEPDAGLPDAGVEDAGPPDVALDAGPLTCWSCHGTAGNPAPPRDTHGVVSRTARTVGAHQAHSGGGTWHRALLCEDCHRVPASPEDPGHLDASPAELVFSAVANAANVSSSFNGTTCTTYCHGASLRGTRPAPDWMNDPAVVCGQCHGVPPPPPHPAATLLQCAGCHIDVFTQGERHIDGTLDVSMSCSSCHGDAASPAPPRDTLGRTATSLRSVGAHRSHLGPSTWRAPVGCGDCHAVPARHDDPRHIDASPAELTPAGTALARGAVPTWDGARCTNYCHGQTINGGSNRAPAWTTVDGSQAACGTCHSLPPSAPHPQNPQCSLCHAAVIDADGGFVDPSLHINGRVEALSTCGSCHALPPATGTHLLHAGVQGTPAYGSLSTAADVTAPTGYAFGCGHCHPTDPARHLSGGRADIELYHSSAPAGSLKAMSPQAVYTPGSTVLTDEQGLPYTQGTCASVYCHSGPAYATPSPVQRPGYDFSFTGYPVVYPPFTLDLSRSFQTVTWGGANAGCGGCHGYPIRTSEPQVSAGVGQSHSFIDAEGYENGHASNHNGTPLSCRTCHYDTVTALNPTSRVNGRAVYGPVPIVGFGQHVNGRAEVAFDTVNDAEVFGWVMPLSSATFNPANNSCSSVTCHLSQTTVVSGSPYRPELGVECNVCHQY